MTTAAVPAMTRDLSMRPWKIVLSGVAAALGVALALLRPGFAAPPAGVASLLLPQLPAVAVILLAVYALVAVLLSAAGLIAPAIDLRRELGRTDALSQATAALDWIAAVEATPLRSLVPRLVGALPRSSVRGPTLLLGSGFDRRAARSEAAHLFYISLARSQCLAALLGLAAVAGLGFAQGWGGAAFPPGNIPTAAALLVLLARFAVDVTIDPLIEAMARLPWEPVDAGRLRHAVELYETARSDPAQGGHVVAQLPRDLPDRLAFALEDGNRGLAAAGERLSDAAEAISRMTRSAIDALAPPAREEGAPASTDDGEVRLAALQAAVEALTAELRQSAAGEPLSAVLDRDRQALAEAVERLTTTAEANGAMTRSAIGALEATLRKVGTRGQSGDRAAAAEELAGLPAAVEALANEMRQLMTLLGTARETAGGRAVATAEIGHALRRLLDDMPPQ